MNTEDSKPDISYYEEVFFDQKITKSNEVLVFCQM